jgi:N-acyl amino acid synthase of PEP-CTERM/exosortase system
MSSDLPNTDLYDRYFAVVPATTPDLLHAAYALRYQVYCVEHAFENPLEHPDGREIDGYDAHSVHAVLIHKPTSEVVGCVRLILPHEGSGITALPMRGLLDDKTGALLDSCDPAHTAEISRYAVSKKLRRRQGEDLYPDVGELSAGEVRRLAPHISVGLIRGVARLAADRGITRVCAAIAPALARLMERFGLVFDPLGPVIDYHGPRQPCIAECEALLAGMASRNFEHFRAIDAVYRSGRSDLDTLVNAPARRKAV